MVGSPHTWCGAHIHGSLASQPASFSGGPGWGGAHNGRWIYSPPPTKAGRLAGQATMYVGSTPCMWAPHHVWVLHHVSGIQVSKYPGIQVSRYPDIQISRYPDIQMSRCPDVQISRYQVSDTRYQVSEKRRKHPTHKKRVFQQIRNEFQRIGQIEAMVHWTPPETSFFIIAHFLYVFCKKLIWDLFCHILNLFCL